MIKLIVWIGRSLWQHLCAPAITCAHANVENAALLQTFAGWLSKANGSLDRRWVEVVYLAYTSYLLIASICHLSHLQTIDKPWNVIISGTFPAWIVNTDGAQRFCTVYAESSWCPRYLMALLEAICLFLALVRLVYTVSYLWNTMLLPCIQVCITT